MSGQPAARVNDIHVCPMVDVLKPHVGGPVLAPGEPTVLIGGMPAARMGDMAMCASPAPDSIIKGAFPVPVGKKPAARMTDNTAHGGVIVMGCPTVLIGLSGTTGNLYVGKNVCQDMKKGRNPPPNTQGPNGAQLQPNTDGQSYNNCGIESSRQLIKAAGGNATQEGLMNSAIASKNASQPAIGSTQGTTVVTAQNQAYFSGGTTSTQQVNILASQHVPASRIVPPTDAGLSLSQFEGPLSEGRGIIANGDVKGLPGWNGQSGFHAVTVTGLEYDDKGNITHVTYNDTGLGVCGKKVTKAEFESFLKWGATNAKKQGFLPPEAVATDKAIW